MKRIIVVEDHEENYYLLQTILSSYAFETWWARNGAEAIEMAQAQLPDLVISDILMPVLDGFGLCRAWKSTPLFQNIPFIFYTATYTDPEDEAFALSLGADGFIAKGLDPADFIQRLNVLLKQFASSGLAVQPPRIQDDTAYYRLYNETLIRKLEEKLLELEQSNQSLRQSEFHYKALLDESQRRLRRIESLHKIDMAISSNNDLDHTLRILLEQVKHQLEVDAVAVLLFDEAGMVFNDTAQLGFKNGRFVQGQVRSNNSLAGIVARRSELVHIDPASSDDSGETALLVEEGFQDYYGIPLVAKERLIGVLELFHCSPLNPDAEWLSYYQTMAGQAAVAIENAQLIERLQVANDELTAAYDATIEGWSRAMDLRDRETEGHTQRVTSMAVDLARKMGISEAEIVHLRRGALLHDIGKMGVPDSILLKPGLLTDDERQQIQRHPVYAFEMLKSVSHLRPAIAIPHYHHEKWDGTGYPYGLQGQQIPIAARLFAIIDVYDALTSDRPYRKAWTEEDTIRYITEQSGKHFDPQIVEVFKQYLKV